MSHGLACWDVTHSWHLALLPATLMTHGLLVFCPGPSSPLPHRQPCWQHRRPRGSLGCRHTAPCTASAWIDFSDPPTGQCWAGAWGAARSGLETFCRAGVCTVSPGRGGALLPVCPVPLECTEWYSVPTKVLPAAAPWYCRGSYEE